MSYTVLRMNKRQLNQTKHLLVIQACLLSYSSTSIKGHKGPVQLLPVGHPCTLSMTSSPALPWLQRWWRVRHWANEYWEHTHTTLVAELWLPSGDDTALALHTELCATSTLTAMFVPFYYEYRPPLLGADNSYPLLMCSPAPRGPHNRSSIRHPALWLFADAPSIILPSPISSADLSTAPSSLVFLLMIYCIITQADSGY